MWPVIKISLYSSTPAMFYLFILDKYVQIWSSWWIFFVFFWKFVFLKNVIKLLNNIKGCIITVFHVGKDQVVIEKINWEGIIWLREVKVDSAGTQEWQRNNESYVERKMQPKSNQNYFAKKKCVFGTQLLGRGYSNILFFRYIWAYLCIFKEFYS